MDRFNPHPLNPLPLLLERGRRGGKIPSGDTPCPGRGQSPLHPHWRQRNRLASKAWFWKLLGFLTLALPVLASAVAVADFALRDWQYSKPLVVASVPTSGGLMEITPDQEVFRHAAPSLADLRIIERGAQREVPYKLLIGQGEVRRQPVPVSLRDLGTVPGQYTSFVADLGQEGRLHNEIEIFTKSENFQRKVVVEASQDAVTWAVLKEGRQVFDLTLKEQGFKTRDTRIPYPDSTARFLRVRVLNGNMDPLDVTGAAVYSTQEIAPQYTSYNATILKREERKEDRATQIIVDVGGYSLPNNRLTIATTDSNFYRRLTLEGSDDTRTWTPLQRGEAIYAYDTLRFKGSHLTVSSPENRYRYLRVSVLNEDNPPLSIQGIEVSGYLRRLIFPASPSATYDLFYGNSGARPPSYDLEQVFPYLVTEDLPRGSLGAEAVNPQFKAKPGKPLTDRYPWLLSTVVAVAALAIGLLLVGVFRQMRRALPPS